VRIPDNAQNGDDNSIRYRAAERTIATQTARENETFETHGGARNRQTR
jgi:hypothetical protein